MVAKDIEHFLSIYWPLVLFLWIHDFVCMWVYICASACDVGARELLVSLLRNTTYLLCDRVSHWSGAHQVE